MKKKLMLKRYNNCYALNDYREPSKGYPLVIAHSDDEHFRYKLSKQNCDEIFGIVDVEKLARNCIKHRYNKYGENTTPETQKLDTIYGFKEGFNKAMELNKDKRFTLEDMRKAIQFGLDGMYGYEAGEDGTTKNQMKRFIQSLQQPTEIEVEIEMEWIFVKTFCDTCNKVMYPDYRCEDKTCFNWQPKLDSEGCLILKKV